VKKLTSLFILLLLFLGIPPIAFGASSSLVIRPDADGAISWIASPIVMDGNYENVDEAVASDADYLYTPTLNNKDEWYRWEGDVSGTILAGAVIDSVVLTERGKCATASQGRTASLKLGTDYTSGPQRTNTTYSDSSYKLSVPQTGGNRTSWTRYNLDSLVVSVKKTLYATGNVYTSQAYVTVYYTPAVSGFDTTSVNGTSVNFICNKSTNTDYKRYQVRYSAGSTPPDSVTAGTYGDSSTADNDTVFAINGLAANTQYSFTVFAKDGVPNWTKKGSGSYKTVTTDFGLSIRPNGDGVTKQWDRIGAGSIHYTAVDEAIGSDTDYVYEYALNEKDEWYMQDVSGTIAAGSVIDSVVLTERGSCGNSSQGRKAGLKIGSDSTWGTQRTNYPITSWTTYDEKLSAPGGRTWTRLNLDSLVVMVKKSLYNADVNVYTSHAYVTVYYTPPVSGVDTTAVDTTSISLKCNKSSNTDYKRYKVMYLAGSTAPDSQNQAGISYADSSTADNDTNFTKSGLSVNTQYSFSIFAKNSVPTWTAKGSGSYKTCYTKAKPPSAPTLSDSTCNTMKVTVRKNGNPTTTQFAVRESTTVGGGNYVQTNGTLGGTAVWQDSANWGTKRVTGLSASTTYYFKTKARNGDSLETAFGSSASQTTSAQSASACTVYVVADSSPLQWTPSSGSSHYSLVDDPAGSPDGSTTYISSTDAKFDWFVPDTFQINCVADNRVIDSVVVWKRTKGPATPPFYDAGTYTYLKDGSDSVWSDGEYITGSTWTNNSWSTTTHPSGANWTKTNLKSTIVGIESFFELGPVLLLCTQIYYIVYHSAVSLGISANPTSWDLDTLNPSQIKTMVTGEKIKVTNTGNVAEQLSLKITDMDTKDEWACTSSASGQGVNKYVMSGVFRHKDSTVTSSNFNAPSGSADVIDTLTQWASSDTFAVGTQAVGASLARSDSLYMWLQMKMPTTASGPKADSTRNVIIQIGCQQAP
jgi:hypothetical protein